MIRDILAQLQSSSTFGLGVLPLYLLFLALPGLVFVKGYIFADRRPDTLDRYDKLGYLLFGGVFSAVILLQLLRWFTPYAPIIGDKIVHFSLLAILTGVLVQSLVAGTFGIVFGVIRYRRGDEIIGLLQRLIRFASGEVGRKFNDRQEPWEYVIDNIREQEVKVVLKDGTQIVGYVARFSSQPTRRTIALSPIEPNRQEEIGREERRINAVYIHDSQIAHVGFRDEETEEEYSDVLPRGDLEPEDIDGGDTVGEETVDTKDDEGD